MPTIGSGRIQPTTGAITFQQAVATSSALTSFSLQTASVGVNLFENFVNNNGNLSLQLRTLDAADGITLNPSGGVIYVGIDTQRFAPISDGIVPWANLPANLQSTPLSFAFAGLAPANQICNVVISTACFIPQDLAGTVVYSGTPPSYDTRFSVGKISHGQTIPFGIITVLRGSNTLSRLSVQPEMHMATGDVLQLRVIDDDASLADVAITIMAIIGEKLKTDNTLLMGAGGLIAIPGPTGPMGDVGVAGQVGPTGPPGMGLTGSIGPTGAAGTGLTNRGQWLTGTLYNGGDYVFSSGALATSSMWIMQGASFTSTTLPKNDLAHWVEFVAPQGNVGPTGPTGVGLSNLIATGTTAARSPADRAADWMNLKDFGAKLDGTTVDTAAVNALLAALGTGASDAIVYAPHGPINYTWAGLTNPGPNDPIHWKFDGVTTGQPPVPITQVSRANKGDLVENYHLGTKYFCMESARPDAQGVIRIDYGFDQVGGSAGAVCTPLRVNCDDNVGAKTSMWGVHVQMHSYANVNDPANWPQNVGVSSSVLRYGKSWTSGMHITMSDMSNQKSSTGAGLLGMEIGHHANGTDDGGLSGSPGLRYGIHLSQSAQVAGSAGGVVPAEFAMGFQVDGTTESLTKTCFGVTGVQTYQVFDARTATAPSGYTSPVAALRMDPGQIIDFNGATTILTTAGWKGAAGNYLQYTTTGTARLRYVDGTAELWSLADTTGAMTWNGLTATGFGTGVGQVPLLTNFQSSGFASLGFDTRLIIYKSGTTSDADFATVQVQRTTNHTGGDPTRIVTNFRASSTIGISVAESEWAIFGQTITSSRAGSQAIGGNFQAIRQTASNSPLWGGILYAIDQTGNASSASPGFITAGEIDVRATGADDGGNGPKYGGKGLRQGLLFSIIRQNPNVDLEVSHGIWFCANEPANARYASTLGFALGVQTYSALDTRGAVAPTGYPDPLAAVRMSAGQIIDFNGGPALNSTAGNYLQYTTAGGIPRLRYMAGSTEVWSVTNTGTAAEKRFTNVFFAADYGMSPSASAATNLAALQAVAAAVNALNNAGAVVILPPGNINFAPGTVTFTGNGITFKGAGRQATILYPTNTTNDFLQFLPTIDQFRTQGVRIEGFRIYWNATHTSGRAILMQRPQNCFLQNLTIEGAYTTIDMIGALSNHLHSITIGGNNSTPGATYVKIHRVKTTVNTSAATASGSVLSFADTSQIFRGDIVSGTNIQNNTSVSSIIKNTSVTLSAAVTGGGVASGAAVTFASFKNSENIVTACNWRSLNNTYTNGFVISSTDGIVISDTHLGFVTGAGLLITPENTDDVIAGVNCNNCDFDQCLNAVEFRALAGFVGTNSSHNFVNCRGIVSTTGFLLNDPAVNNVSFSGCSPNVNKQGAYNIQAGTNISIAGGYLFANNQNNGGYNQILIGGTAQYVVVSGVTFGGVGYIAPPYHIAIANSADHIVISPNVYQLATTGDVSVTTTGTHLTIYPGQSDKATPNVMLLPILTSAINDTAAATAGVAIGQFYRNGSTIMQRVV